MYDCYINIFLLNMHCEFYMKDIHTSSLYDKTFTVHRKKYMYQPKLC